MATIEERVSSLEARVDAQVVGLKDLRQAVVHLEERMDRRFSALEAQFEARFAGVETRFAGLDARFTGVEGRFTGLDTRLSALATSLDTKIDHLTSIVVWAFAAILTAVSALTVGLLLQ